MLPSGATKDGQGPQTLRLEVALMVPPGELRERLAAKSDETRRVLWSSGVYVQSVRLRGPMGRLVQSMSLPFFTGRSPYAL